MKEKARVKLYTLSLVAAGILLLFFSSALKQGVIKGLDICGNTLIPSLFPFLCLCALAVSVPPRAPGVLGRGFSALFHLPAASGKVVFLSLLSGYPAGPLMCATLLEEGQISPQEARRMSLFACAAGPSFSVIAIGEGLCASKSIGFILLASNVLSQLLIGIALGLFARKEPLCQGEKLYTQSFDISTALCAAVEKSIAAALSLCAYVLLFSAILELLRLSPLPAAVMAPLAAVLELTNGCVHYPTNPPVLAAILGFGGLSIFFQVKKYLLKTGTSSVSFLLARGCSAALNFLICSLLLRLFPQAVPTMAREITFKPLSYSAPLCAVLFFAFAAFVLENKKSVKLR